MLYAAAVSPEGSNCITSASTFSPILILYGSQTGNAEEISKSWHAALLEEHYYIRDFHEAGMINWYEIDMSEIEELDEPDAVYDEYDDEESDIDVDDIDDYPEDTEYGAPEELDFEK